MRRLVDAALRGAADPRYSTVIGRMMLEHRLTAAEYGAAQSYGGLRGRHDRAIGLPRRTAAGVRFEPPRGEPRELDEKRLAALRRKHAALLAEIGRDKALLDRVILDDELPRPGEMPRLKAVLDGLARWLGEGLP